MQSGWDLDDGGKRIVGREDRELHRTAERGQILAHRHASGAYLADRDRKIRQRAHPTDAGPPAPLVDLLPPEKTPEEVRKVDAGGPAQRVPAPHAGVDVEELEGAIAGVTLEFDLDDPIEPQRVQDAPRDPLDVRRVNGLDIRARPSEIHRPLSCPPRGKRRHDVSVAAERRERELGLATSGNDLLDHDEGRFNERDGLFVARHETGRVVGRPREASARVSRRVREGVIVPDEPDRNAVPPETPDDSERLVVAPEHHRARLPRHHRGRPSGARYRARRSPLNVGMTWRWTMDRARVLAAKSVPATKRTSGPNEWTAGAPRKCSPGTEDWKPSSSTGCPSTHTTRETSDRARTA